MINISYLTKYYKYLHFSELEHFTTKHYYYHFHFNKLFIHSYVHIK